MTLRERIRDFIWIYFRDKYTCPACRCDSVIYANFEPRIFCGDCGWKLREGYFR